MQPMNRDLEVLAAHQTRLVGWALHELGRALFLGSFVGLVAALVIGVLAIPLAGLICSVYLLLATAPASPTRSTDMEATPFVIEE